MARLERVRVADRDTIDRLAHAASASERALDALLAAVRPAFALFFAQRLPHDVAEDLTQVALIRAAQLVGRVRADRFGQHMSTIARGLLHDERERQARERRQAARAMLVAIVESPVDVEAQSELEDLMRVIESASARLLSPELQTVVMGVLRGRTLAEIAADTQLEMMTIKRRLARVRAILRRELGVGVWRGGQAPRA